MEPKIRSVIAGTGHYIPTERIRNEDFLKHEFYDQSGERIDKSNREIIDKFKAITSIEERRHVTEDLVTSDIAYYSAEEAISSAKLDRERLDRIIVAHNFGDVTHENRRSDLVPSLAARVKERLGIASGGTIAHDLPFGCPGWLEAMIQADRIIRSGDEERILVIGAEVLSRVSDPHDRDSMLYGDGAGAAVLEAKESEDPVGVLAHGSRSDTAEYSEMLHMGGSNKPDSEEGSELYLKMYGRKLYQYALEKVPEAIRNCLEKSNTHLKEVKKVLLHQANGKMDDEILKRLYSLYDGLKPPKNVMPMTISWLGNSSVATLPTLLDLLLKGKMEEHEVTEGDTIVMASVGAGMNINAMVYRF